MIRLTARYAPTSRSRRPQIVCKKSAASKKGKTSKSGPISAPTPAPAAIQPVAPRPSSRVEVVRKYRRPKRTSEDLKKEREQQQEEWKASLQLPLEQVQFALRQQASRLPGVVLVDAYNVIGAWPELVRLKEGESLQAARALLQEYASELSVERGQRVVLVYDAMEGSSVAPLRKYQLPGKVSVVFSAQHSADIQLSEEAEFWVAQGASEVTVVTNDNNVRHSISTAGAARNVHCMPVSWMMQECNKIRQQLLQEVKLQLHKEQLEWRKLKKLAG